MASFTGIAGNVVETITNMFRPDFFRPLRFMAVVYTLTLTRQPLNLSYETVRTELANPGHDTPGFAWFGVDSYAHDGRCYCYPVHMYGKLVDEIIETEAGNMTVGEACALAGEGPGPIGNPLYNDVQCGHGPVGSKDEARCPGRIDQGEAGCAVVGPKWQFDI